MEKRASAIPRGEGVKGLLGRERACQGTYPEDRSQGRRAKSRDPWLTLPSASCLVWRSTFLEPHSSACVRMHVHVCVCSVHVCMASEVMDVASLFSSVTQDRVPDRGQSRVAKLPGDRQLGYSSPSQPDGLTD